MTVLQLVWFGLLGLGLALFVVTDGADFGIGVLSLGARDEAERSIMFAAIGPMWYANETWLIITGAVLFGAFPLAFGILLSAFYIPATVLVIGLVLRAVSTEFRAHSKNRPLWGALFAAGSILAILAQGFMLGGLLSGLTVANGEFAGGTWDWFNLTSVLVAVGIVGGYLMLGASRMVRRTTGDYEKRYRRVLRNTALVSVGALVCLVAVLPFADSAVSGVWFQPLHILASAVLLAATLFGLAMLLVGVSRDMGERGLYAWAVTTFISATCAAVAAIFPYLVPASVTISQAAAPDETLLFMLVGVGVVLPVIVVYNLWARGVFQGKVRGTDDEEY